MGTAHKFVFGTLDEDDKIYLHKKIDKFNQGSDQTLSLLENQTQIIKSKFLVCKNSIVHVRNELSKTKQLINSAIHEVGKIMN